MIIDKAAPLLLWVGVDIIDVPDVKPGAGTNQVMA
jgi:hypothetical protein